MKLEEKILTLRKREGLSQEELAFKLGVSRQAVYKWESGTALPEIDKLKLISSIFKVSFDYLMNDDIDNYAIEPPKQTIPKYRKVFYSGKPLDYKYIDYDAGYFEDDVKNRDDNADVYLYKRIQTRNSILKQFNITEIMDMHPDSATAFFYDNKTKYFGFYYTNGIQFLCPIENFISFDFTGGGQTLRNVKNTGITGIVGGIFGIGVSSENDVVAEDDFFFKTTLMYRDGNEVKTLEFTLSGACSYTILNKEAKRPGDIDINVTFATHTITGLLTKIKTKLLTLSFMRDQILQKLVPASDFDFKLLASVLEISKNDYERFKKEVLENKAKVKKRKFIKTLITISIVAVAIIVMLVSC